MTVHNAARIVIFPRDQRKCSAILSPNAQINAYKGNVNNADHKNAGATNAALLNALIALWTMIASSNINLPFSFVGLLYRYV
jgi:hypothetical protein